MPPGTVFVEPSSSKRQQTCRLLDDLQHEHQGDWQRVGVIQTKIVARTTDGIDYSLEIDAAFMPINNAVCCPGTRGPALPVSVLLKYGYSTTGVGAVHQENVRISVEVRDGAQLNGTF